MTVPSRMSHFGSRRSTTGPQSGLKTPNSRLRRDEATDIWAIVQPKVELTGPTSWLQRAPYHAHPEKQPIAFQDHGNPVRFRNVWVRELGKPGRKEFMLPTTLLESYTGKYDNIEVARESNQLTAKIGGLKFPLFAESPAKFFAKTTDVQVEFPDGGQGKPDRLIWSVGEGANEAKRNK